MRQSDGGFFLFFSFRSSREVLIFFKVLELDHTPTEANDER